METCLLMSIYIDHHFYLIHFLLQKEVIHHIEDVGPEWSCTSLAMFKAYVVRIRMQIDL